MAMYDDETREKYSKRLQAHDAGTWEAVQAGGESAERVVIELLEIIARMEDEWAWRDCPEGD